MTDSGEPERGPDQPWSYQGSAGDEDADRQVFGVTRQDAIPPSGSGKAEPADQHPAGAGSLERGSVEHGSIQHGDPGEHKPAGRHGGHDDPPFGLPQFGRPQPEAGHYGGADVGFPDVHYYGHAGTDRSLPDASPAAAAPPSPATSKPVLDAPGGSTQPPAVTGPVPHLPPEPASYQAATEALGGAPDQHRAQPPDPVGAFPAADYGTPFGLAPAAPTYAQHSAPNAYGPDPHAPDLHADPYAPNPSAQDSDAQSPAGQDQYGQHSYAPDQYAQEPFPQAQFGRNQHERPAFDPGAEGQPVYGSHTASAPSRSRPSRSRPAQPTPAQPPATAEAPERSPGVPPPEAQPRPEALLVPSHRAAESLEAKSGWQGRMRRLTGGLIKPAPSADELAERKDVHDIQRTFSRPMTIVVVQPKGGAGKTPATIGLASALGSHRGGYVVGWDDNETRGTLAVRVDNADNQSTTVWDLLRDLPSFERTDARVGDLSHYVRGQGTAQFDALVSDDSPGNMAQIGESEFQRIHAVLQRFYRQIVIDTGNNVRSPNWQAAVNAADQIVVVSTYQRDVGYSGSWVLDHLIETGRAELAASAITVLSAADPRQDPAVRSELISHFSQRTRAVVEIPYDPLIALGGPIEWSRLNPATLRAWTHAGAAVVNALAAQDEAERLANRTP